MVIIRYSFLFPFNDIFRRVKVIRCYTRQLLISQVQKSITLNIRIGNNAYYISIFVPMLCTWWARQNLQINKFLESFRDSVVKYNVDRDLW